MSYCYNHVTKEEGCEYLRDFSRELEKQFDKNPNRKSVTFDANFIKKNMGRYDEFELDYTSKRE